MKRRIVVGVVVCVSLGLNVVLLLPYVGQEAAFAGPPSGNGDVNGSGAIDIADAIWILSYLFAKGPEPEAIECAGGGLPATGQAACYGYVAQQGWVEVPCDSAEYPGQDGFYQKGCPQEGRFVDNGDGTVTDNCTGLTWQKETAPGTYTWQQALQYCEGLEFAGHDDWRLPNVREFQSIVDYGRWDPSIEPVFGVESGWYWSSSTYVVNPYVAWYVDFTNGIVNSNLKTTDNFVRAVRG